MTAQWRAGPETTLARTVAPIKRRVGIAIFFVVLLAAGIVIAFAAGAFKTPLTPAQIAAERAARAAAKERAAEIRDVNGAEKLVNVLVPQSGKTPQPAPAEPTHLFSRPLSPVDVLGFVPYWEASSITPGELDDVSTIALFGVEASWRGSFLESGPGWSDYAASGYSSLISLAHQAGDRVLFTISTTNPGAIHHLTSDPSSTASPLARALSGAVASGGLDGVDIDIEGSSESERTGFVTFTRDLVHSLRLDGMHGEVVIDCYPQAAGDSTDFFDVARLAPLVDQVFVMAYDMEQYANSSATAPLASDDLGLSDVQSLIQYTKVVPADKLILGVPFYGIDFTTTSSQAGAPALTPAPSEETYKTIVAAKRPPLWDPISRTVWTHFKDGKSWHQTWYDNPISIGLKRALAARFHLAGVGVWALGFEGSSTQMLSALDGGVAPKRFATSG